MSAPSDSGASPSSCACTNISLMQLFHELKQKFPAVPDHVVSHTIELYCHDKNACETHLHSEAKASLTHAYHASSIAAARQLNELRVSAPLKCPNQPILKHEIQNPTAVKSIACQGPQTATLSSSADFSETEDTEIVKVNTDANQNIVETKDYETSLNKNVPSPVTINLDNCVAKYCKESPSDLESTNEEVKEETSDTPPTETRDLEGTNYKILKSNKIKYNLHEKLEKSKKAIKKEEPSVNEKAHTPIETPIPQIENPQIEKDTSSIEPQAQLTPPPDKPKRPNTLDFAKPNPDIAFKQTLNKPEADTNRSVSPIPPQKPPAKETTPGGSYWPERGYPLNLSVNVNCHMDYSHPWLEDYDSPRAITSVNLTVCTPTSNMASPIRDTRDEEGGFEGHVTVTVSPSSARAPRRRAPPPPPQHPVVDSQRCNNNARGPADLSYPDRSLIERQKERLGRLAAAVAQEKGRLAQLNRETQILAAPPPTAHDARRLRDYVAYLREQCHSLAKRLELSGNEPDAVDFYSNIYTGQRPAAARRPARAAPPPPDDAASWQCHVCTFRNHPLLDKCEECEMPRILVGTSPSTTLDSGFGSFRNASRRPQLDTNLFNPPDERPAHRACV